MSLPEWTELSKEPLQSLSSSDALLPFVSVTNAHL